MLMSSTILKVESFAKCSDSYKWLKNQKSDIYDCVITSPPYGLNIPYDGYNDNADDCLSNITPIIEQAVRCLKPGGRICVNVMPNTNISQPTHLLITQQLMALGCVWITEIIWNKGMVSNWYPRGSWASPSKPWYQHSHEYIIVAGKGSWERQDSIKSKTMTNDQYKKWTTPLWNIQPQHQRTDQHPAQFPDELVERLILLNTQPGELILDPFGGIGNTLIKSIQLDRYCHSIDQSQQYSDQAQKRLDQELHFNTLFEVDK